MLVNSDLQGIRPRVDMQTKDRSVRLTTETGRRLKIYASAYDLTTEDLAEQILLFWLDRQPPVGGSHPYIALEKTFERSLDSIRVDKQLVSIN